MITSTKETYGMGSLRASIVWTSFCRDDEEDVILVIFVVVVDDCCCC